MFDYEHWYADINKEKGKRGAFSNQHGGIQERATTLLDHIK